MITLLLAQGVDANPDPSQLPGGQVLQGGKSIVLPSNKSYGQLGEIFPDPVLATALLDRLLQHATTINICGESDRLHRRGSGLQTNNPERRPDMSPE